MQEIISNKVYELRSKTGITQEALAESIGVKRQTIIAIEKGNYTPSVILALKIGKFFKKPLEEIFSIKYEKYFFTRNLYFRCAHSATRAVFKPVRILDAEYTFIDDDRRTDCRIRFICELYLERNCAG